MLVPAVESDWEAIRRLSVQIHDLHAAWRPDIYCHSDAPYPKAAFLEDVRCNRLYVYRIDGKAAGYVVLMDMEKSGPGVVAHRMLRIDSICVDETLRGQGIGSAMMEDVFRLAKERGYSNLFLGVHPENDKALAFYKKYGFDVRTVNMQKKL